MTEQNEISVVQVMRKERALDVIELMRRGKTQKEALDEIGVEKRTFSNTIADFPEIMQDIQNLQRSRIANLAENVILDQEKNAEALATRAETLRLLLKSDVFAIGVAKELIAIDNHLQKTLAMLYPIQEKGHREQQSPSSSDAAAATKVLASMKGAQLRHVEVKVETYRMEIGGRPDSSDVVDGNVTEDLLPETGNTP